MSNLLDDLKTVLDYIDYDNVYAKGVLKICIESVKELEKENADLKNGFSCTNNCWEEQESLLYFTHELQKLAT